MISNAFTLSIGLNFGLALSTIVDILPNFMEEFRIYQPFIINDMLEIKYVKEVVKNLNYQGYSIGFGQKEVLRKNRNNHILLTSIFKVQCKAVFCGHLYLKIIQYE